MRRPYRAATRTLEQVVISEEPRAVIAGMQLFSTLPDIDVSFRELDKEYAADKPAFLGKLATSVEDVPDVPGLTVSFITNDRVVSNGKLGIIKTPLDGTYPQSNHLTLTRYARDETPSWLAKQRAKPHTYNEVGKLFTDFYVGDHQEVGMTMAMIYNLPKEVFTAEEQAQIKAGDTSPMGRIYKAVADFAQEKFHGKDSETQFTELYGYEHGMGHELVGAADKIQAESDKYRFKAIILPNMVSNVNNRVLLLARYSLMANMGKESEFDPGKYVEIPEPLFRYTLDKNGAELMMRIRQIKAMAGLFDPGAMVRSKWIQEALVRIADSGVATLAPISVNARIARNTVNVFPHGHPNFWMLPVIAKKGEKAGLITNENYSLGAVLWVEGVKFAEELEKSRLSNGVKV